MATQNTETKAKIPKAKKVNAFRNVEYYGLQETFDNLFANSKDGKFFDHLMELILSRENILLAYRSMKGNTGSLTPGTDGLTTQDLAKFTPENVVLRVRTILKHYRPRAVRRVDIPKEGYLDKTRPLGIPCIWDRLIQKCILQVLEPICEARFSDNSYGFRPNRSCENAVAHAYKLMQQSKLHFVVEVDVKSFFDNVNHSKLVKQMWAMGIRDKALIYIIRQMLKAPIKMPDGTEVKPEKGTPQGGLCSPLLANIVLNELDRWVESQWQQNPVIGNYTIGTNTNGSPNYGHGYEAMKKTNLKEMYIVRYADDFRIFCRTRSAAVKTMAAVSQWLETRLRLQVSPEKTRVVNLKRQYSEFLGIKMKVWKKNDKYVVKSHVGDKAKRKILHKAESLCRAISHPKDKRGEHEAIQAYNAFVMGEHNYFRMATNVSLDFKYIAYRADRKLKKCLGSKLKRAPTTKVETAVTKRYGKSGQLRFVSNRPVAAIGYVQTKNPINRRRSVQKYTSEGRKAIHDTLRINTGLMLALMRQPLFDRSVEYMDNRISLFCAQYGRCAVTQREFKSVKEIHCHHRFPKSNGGKDNYKNLILVIPEMHILIHATDGDTISRYLNLLQLTPREIVRLNGLRQEAGNPPI